MSPEDKVRELLLKSLTSPSEVHKALQAHAAVIVQPGIKKLIENIATMNAIIKGNARSGHWGHKGVKGRKGGSAPRLGGPKPKPDAAHVEAKPEVAAPEGPPPLQPPPPSWLTADAKITDIDQIRGKHNVNSKYYGYITDADGVRHKVSLAPVSGLADRAFRQYLRIAHDNDYEQAAAIINNALERPVDVPAGLMRNIPGHGPGLVLEWREGENGGLYNAPERERDGMGFFDAVIGNLDRHHNNFLVDASHHLIALDHGLAFPAKNSSQYINDQVIQDRIGRRGSRLADDESRLLDNMIIRRNEIDTALKPYLDQPEINAMWQRVDYMRRNKELAWAGGGPLRVAKEPKGPEAMKPPTPPVVKPVKPPSPVVMPHGFGVFDEPPKQGPKPASFPPFGSPIRAQPRKRPIISAEWSRLNREAAARQAERVARFGKLRQKIAASLTFVNAIFKGGPGSGYHGPRPGTGRPNQVGGSRSQGTEREPTDPAQGSLRFPEQLTLPFKDPTQGPQFEGWLVNGEITDIEDLGGGISETYTGYIGDQKVKVVPDDGLNHGHLHEGVRPGADNAREVAARIVNEAMGNFVEIPPSTLRETPMGFGLVQEFRAGTILAKSSVRPSDDEMRSTAVFDAVIANVDRHEQNYLIDEHGKGVAIDHGLSFPSHNGPNVGINGNHNAVEWFNYRTDGRLRDSEMAALNRLEQHHAGVTKWLTPYLHSDEIDAMWERVEKMRTTRKLAPAHSFGNGRSSRGSRESRESSFVAAEDSDISF